MRCEISFLRKRDSFSTWRPRLIFISVKDGVVLLFCVVLLLRKLDKSFWIANPVIGPRDYKSRGTGAQGSVFTASYFYLMFKMLK